jgi:hypothetical protein
MPSTDVTFWTPGGKVCEKAAAASRSAAMAVRVRTIRRINTFYDGLLGLYQEMTI